MIQKNTYIKYKNWEPIYKMLVLAGFSASLILFGIVFGLLYGTPLEIIRGLYLIIIHPDVLLTDYIKIGGLGAAFLNSGLLTAIFTFILWKNGDPFNGATFASILIVTGFSFLGKNLLNVWPILIGVALYTRFHNEHFGRYIYVALFGTAMAPIVTEVLFHFDLTLPLRLITGIILGLLVGFILPPLADHFSKSGKGYNLYNVGFVAGLLLTLLVALFISFGYTPTSNLILENSYHFLLAGYLYFISIVFILIGLFSDKESVRYLKRLYKRSGKAPTDFIQLDGFSATLLNMGFNGVLAVSYTLLVGGELSGGVIGPIFTIIGFSAYGKHARNIFPILVGALLGGVFGIWDVSYPTIIMAALFGTALGPIPGTYGWHWGVFVGFLHISVVRHIGVFHGGLNLYNNGFSTGIIAMILVPILENLARPLKICESVANTKQIPDFIKVIPK